MKRVNPSAQSFSERKWMISEDLIHGVVSTVSKIMLHSLNVLRLGGACSYRHHTQVTTI